MNSKKIIAPIIFWFLSFILIIVGISLNVSENNSSSKNKNYEEVNVGNSDYIDFDTTYKLYCSQAGCYYIRIKTHNYYSSTSNFPTITFQGNNLINTNNLSTYKEYYVYFSSGYNYFSFTKGSNYTSNAYYFTITRQ